jgi:hypothetical protein
MQRSFVLAIGLLSLTGCEFVSALEDGEEAEGRADGALCGGPEDCKSERCTTAQLCAHSPCRCSGDACGPNGKESSACSEGWVCTDASNYFDDVREFFGGEAPKDRGYCQPTCEAGCPEHYTCSGGTFCKPNTDWANPVPTIRWTGASEGDTSDSNMKRVELEFKGSVTLRASASSPTGASITRYHWSWSSSRASGESEEQELELPLDPETNYLRAQLIVSDERSRSGLTDVVFESCFGSGTTCGYEGSGCCSGCDRETDRCK